MERVFVPRPESVPKAVLTAMVVGAGVLGGMRLWQGLPWSWSVLAGCFGAGFSIYPTFRGQDTLVLDDSAVTCRRGERSWTISYDQIFRIYKFNEQWIFESQPPHRRFTFDLRGHDAHLGEIAKLLDERAQTLGLGWLESIARIVQHLR